MLTVPVRSRGLTSHGISACLWICPEPEAPEARTRNCIYQLAFFTPGIRPALAISRNWIREMPNWRM